MDQWSTSSAPSFLESLRGRLKQCPDTEPEQAILRVIIGCAVFAYLYSAGAFHGDNGDVTKPFELGFLTGFVLFSLALLAVIAIHPVKSVSRRLVGMVADLGATSYGMLGTGPFGAPLYVVFLWVTFGNGFRYGVRYLYIATVFSAVGFGLVLYVSPYWSSLKVLGAGLLIGIIVLPIYVSALIKRLNDATMRAEEASRAKSRFLANVSHEIRTPLNGVVGMSHLLGQSRLSREQFDYVETISASASTLLGLIDNVLDISKIEAGKVVVEKTDLHLHRLVRSTAKMLKPEADAKGIYLDVEVDSDLPYRLSGDALHLRQVLINLLGNAIKFTDSGGVRLKVSRLREETSHVRVCFEVVDTGVGIPRDVQDQIFDSFTQGDSTITRRFGGTGLGTTISKQLVELMGGDIGFSSDPGGGTRFWFELDLDRCSPAGPPSKGIAEEGEPVGPAKYILVAEDNAINRKVIAKILESAGHRVDLVEDGEEALAALYRTSYDLAIMDLQMPQMGGLQAVRRYLGGGDSLPFIVLTANATTDAVQECADAGVRACLTKPVEARHLLAVVSSVTRAQSVS